MIEIIIYIAIVVVVIFVIVEFTWHIIFGRMENQAMQEVHQNASLAMEAMSRAIRRAFDIDLEKSIFDINPGRLWLKYSQEELFLYVFDVSNDRLRVRSKTGALSCGVATTCPDGVIILRMSGITNAHGGLPEQSNYSLLICCRGVPGLGNSCSGNYVPVIRLSSPHNAHVSQTEYPYKACISVPPSRTVSVGYASDCIAAGYDTTLASMSGVTNAHLGYPRAYPIKICASVKPPVEFDYDFLTSDKVKVTNLIFKNLSTPTEPKNIFISLTIEHKNPEGRRELAKSVTLETTVTLRQK